MHDTGQYVMHADCGVCTSGLGTLTFVILAANALLLILY